MDKDDEGKQFPPTHGGTSRPKVPAKAESAVHHHACGNINLWRFVRREVSGSPPRMWEHHQVQHGLFTSWRFTPTHVGTSLRIIAWSR